MNNVLNVLFRSIKDGHLKRLSYLGYCLLLVFSLITFVFMVILMVGTGENIIGGDLLQAQDKLREWFTIPFLVILGLFLMVLVYAGTNITAKRIRDIGLPGWWVVLIIVILGIIISFTVSNQVSSGLHYLIWILLLLLPTNFLNRKKQMLSK